uniref:Uncharacterized protein n=1 Tax=Chromera velia CCMP2878 TaxID=1169474 RepID=A0A0G4F3J7_9ALVE|eukprot:Cvel_2659.t1-p1 / transcript=Cvel_2659.t1 / gene=Cvel_2659 / organism=Chromera_velia_CCMP2878 / gene_product=Leucine-rich repeat and calponin homology, putative / transcript_product=Leucine-rich repeat and calponin homology, putative / location=Cvel_scaffold106:8676-27414(+) / protein_length=3234 / sequence_SO=supercontig / SO=protein_coding / is_pseudo=false
MASVSSCSVPTLTSGAVVALLRQNRLERAEDIRTLNLEGGSMTVIASEAFQMLSGVTTLNLSVNSLLVLPKSISSLRNLQRLRVDSNNLSTLPAGLCECSQLIHLSARQNRLTTWPETRGLLNLKELLLSGNLIKTVPESVGDLPLSSLHIVSNRFTTLPVAFAQLRHSLETLGLEWFCLCGMRFEGSEIRRLVDSAVVFRRLYPDSEGDLSPPVNGKGKGKGKERETAGCGSSSERERGAFTFLSPGSHWRGGGSARGAIGKRDREKQREKDEAKKLDSALMEALMDAVEELGAGKERDSQLSLLKCVEAMERRLESSLAGPPRGSASTPLSLSGGPASFLEMHDRKENSCCTLRTSLGSSVGVRGPPLPLSLGPNPFPLNGRSGQSVASFCFSDAQMEGQNGGQGLDLLEEAAGAGQIAPSGFARLDFAVRGAFFGVAKALVEEGGVDPRGFSFRPCSNGRGRGRGDHSSNSNAHCAASSSSASHISSGSGCRGGQQHQETEIDTHSAEEGGSSAIGSRSQEQGASPDGMVMSPLALAMTFGSEDIAILLIENGASLTEGFLSFENAFLYAVQTRMPKVVDIAARLGCTAGAGADGSGSAREGDGTEGEGGGNSCGVSTAGDRERERAQYALARRGEGVRDRTSGGANGFGAFHLLFFDFDNGSATRASGEKIFDRLNATSADRNALAASDVTPLYVAVQRKNYRALSLICRSVLNAPSECRAGNCTHAWEHERRRQRRRTGKTATTGCPLVFDLDAPSYCFRWSALHKVSIDSNLAAVAELVAAGASVLVRNAQGRTPRAVSRGNLTIMKVLRSAEKDWLFGKTGCRLVEPRHPVLSVEEQAQKLKVAGFIPVDISADLLCDPFTTDARSRGAAGDGGLADQKGNVTHGEERRGGASRLRLRPAPRPSPLKPSAAGQASRSHSPSTRRARAVPSPISIPSSTSKPTEAVRSLSAKNETPPPPSPSFFSTLAPPPIARRGTATRGATGGGDQSNTHTPVIIQRTVPPPPVAPPPGIGQNADAPEEPPEAFVHSLSSVLRKVDSAAASVRAPAGALTGVQEGRHDGTVSDSSLASFLREETAGLADRVTVSVSALPPCPASVGPSPRDSQNGAQGLRAGSREGEEEEEEDGWGDASLGEESVAALDLLDASFEVESQVKAFSQERKKGSKKEGGGETVDPSQHCLSEGGERSVWRQAASEGVARGRGEETDRVLHSTADDEAECPVPSEMPLLRRNLVDPSPLPDPLLRDPMGAEDDGRRGRSDSDEWEMEGIASLSPSPSPCPHNSIAMRALSESSPSLPATAAPCRGPAVTAPCGGGGGERRETKGSERMNASGTRFLFPPDQDGQQMSGGETQCSAPLPPPCRGGGRDAQQNQSWSSTSQFLFPSLAGAARGVSSSSASSSSSSCGVSLTGRIAHRAATLGFDSYRVPSIRLDLMLPFGEDAERRGSKLLECARAAATETAMGPRKPSLFSGTLGSAGRAAAASGGSIHSHARGARARLATALSKPGIGACELLFEDDKHGVGGQRQGRQGEGDGGTAGAAGLYALCQAGDEDGVRQWVSLLAARVGWGRAGAALAELRGRGGRTVLHALCDTTSEERDSKGAAGSLWSSRGRPQHERLRGRGGSGKGRHGSGFTLASSASGLSDSGSASCGEGAAAQSGGPVWGRLNTLSFLFQTCGGALRGLVNHGDGAGRTPLHWACNMTPPRAGQHGMVAVLLTQGADPNRAERTSGWTPTHFAVYTKAMGPLLELLCNPATAVEASDAADWPLVFLAAQKLNRKGLALLVNGGAGLNSVTSSGEDLADALDPLCLSSHEREREERLWLCRAVVANGFEFGHSSLVRPRRGGRAGGSGGGELVDPQTLALLDADRSRFLRRAHGVQMPPFVLPESLTSRCDGCGVSFGSLGWRHSCRSCGCALCGSCTRLVTPRRPLLDLQLRQVRKRVAIDNSRGRQSAAAFVSESKIGEAPGQLTGKGTCRLTGPPGALKGAGSNPGGGAPSSSSSGGPRTASTAASRSGTLTGSAVLGYSSVLAVSGPSASSGGVSESQSRHGQERRGGMKTPGRDTSSQGIEGTKLGDKREGHTQGPTSSGGAPGREGPGRGEPLLSTPARAPRLQPPTAPHLSPDVAESPCEDLDGPEGLETGGGRSFFGFGGGGRTRGVSMSSGRRGVRVHGGDEDVVGGADEEEEEDAMMLCSSFVQPDSSASASRAVVPAGGRASSSSAPPRGAARASVGMWASTSSAVWGGQSEEGGESVGCPDENRGDSDDGEEPLPVLKEKLFPFSPLGRSTFPSSLSPGARQQVGATPSGKRGTARLNVPTQSGGKQGENAGQRERGQSAPPFGLVPFLPLPLRTAHVNSSSSVDPQTETQAGVGRGFEWEEPEAYTGREAERPPPCSLNASLMKPSSRTVPLSSALATSRAVSAGGGKSGGPQRFASSKCVKEETKEEYSKMSAEADQEGTTAGGGGGWLGGRRLRLSAPLATVFRSPVGRGRGVMGGKGLREHRGRAGTSASSLSPNAPVQHPGHSRSPLPPPSPFDALSPSPERPVAKHGGATKDFSGEWVRGVAGPRGCRREGASQEDPTFAFPDLNDSSSSSCRKVEGVAATSPRRGVRRHQTQTYEEGRRVAEMNERDKNDKPIFGTAVRRVRRSLSLSLPLVRFHRHAPKLTDPTAETAGEKVDVPRQGDTLAVKTSLEKSRGGQRGGQHRNSRSRRHTPQRGARSRKPSSSASARALSKEATVRQRQRRHVNPFGSLLGKLRRRWKGKGRAPASCVVGEMEKGAGGGEGGCSQREKEIEGPGGSQELSGDKKKKKSRELSINGGEADHFLSGPIPPRGGDGRGGLNEEAGVLSAPCSPDSQGECRESYGGAGTGTGAPRPSGLASSDCWQAATSGVGGLSSSGDGTLERSSGRMGGFAGMGVGGVVVQGSRTFQPQEEETERTYTSGSGGGKAIEREIQCSGGREGAVSSSSSVEGDFEKAVSELIGIMPPSSGEASSTGRSGYKQGTHLTQQQQQQSSKISLCPFDPSAASLGSVPAATAAELFLKNSPGSSIEDENFPQTAKDRGREKGWRGREEAGRRSSTSRHDDRDPTSSPQPSASSPVPPQVGQLPKGPDAGVASGSRFAGRGPERGQAASSSIVQGGHGHLSLPPRLAALAAPLDGASARRVSDCWRAFEQIRRESRDDGLFGGRGGWRTMALRGGMDSASEMCAECAEFYGSSPDSGTGLIMTGGGPV